MILARWRVGTGYAGFGGFGGGGKAQKGQNRSRDYQTSDTSKFGLGIRLVARPSFFLQLVTDWLLMPWSSSRLDPTGETGVTGETAPDLGRLDGTSHQSRPSI